MKKKNNTQLKWNMPTENNKNKNKQENEGRTRICDKNLVMKLLSNTRLTFLTSNYRSNNYRFYGNRFRHFLEDNSVHPVFTSFSVIISLWSQNFKLTFESYSFTPNTSELQLIRRRLVLSSVPRVDTKHDSEVSSEGILVMGF